jgi:hypothetical protein
MNCEQVNQMDLVDYLFTLGYSPAKISGKSYWYHSPFREEKTPSFKIDRAKNIWYDHGENKGGKLVDFASHFFHCITISEALSKIEEKQSNTIASFHRPKKQTVITDLSEDNTIRILSVKDSITDLELRRYLKQRRIPLSIAETFCKQIAYRSGKYQYTAIGFKNSAGGYELRSANFKGSSSPKYVTYFNNQANAISVFEGFFDFLTWQSIYKNEELPKTNILILNSLSFFKRSLLLMEKHAHIHLYLDHDKRGRECTELLQQRNRNVTDESKLYKGCKDLNEWVVKFGKQHKERMSKGLHL